MTSQVLKALIREQTGKKANRLREEDKIPCVLYGHGIENKNITVEKRDLEKTYKAAGYSHLIDLDLGAGKPVKALIYDIQKDPVSDKIMHVDFYQVKEGEKITTEIPLEFINESPAVKALGAILVTNYNNINIKCLPNDLEKIGKVQIDLSGLINFSDSIHIKDLQLPDGVEVIQSPDELIVIATEPVEEKIEETPASAAEVKTVGEEKTEKAAEASGEKEGAAKENK